MRRILFIEGEEEGEEEPAIRRRRAWRPRRPGPEELLRRLIELRLREGLDGDAFWELLDEYAARAGPQAIEGALELVAGRDLELEVRLRRCLGWR